MDYRIGDHVKVRGLVTSDRGDDHLAVQFETYGASAYVPRSSVEFLHGDFKKGDEVVMTLSGLPARVLVTIGTQAWIRYESGRGDTIASFEELVMAAKLEPEFAEVEVPPAPTPAAGGESPF